MSSKDASREVVLVAHSNAGLFVPAVMASLSHRVRAAVFVDAALPAHAEESPMASAEVLEQLADLADEDDLLPPWTDWFPKSEMAALFPDERTRRRVCAEQPRLPLSYFKESVPVSLGWDTGRCGYIAFSPAYERLAAEAVEHGWLVRWLPGGHLHQLVDPVAVTEAIVEVSTWTLDVIQSSVPPPTRGSRASSAPLSAAGTRSPASRRGRSVRCSRPGAPA